MDDVFGAWVPIRRAQTHRTHGQLIGTRADADRAALGPLPELPYLVTDRHLRRVGKDALVSFEASLYSVPARRVRAGQRVELRVTRDQVGIHALAGDLPPATAGLLAVHARARTRGAWVVDPAHWDGLPDGAGRATVVEAGGRDLDPATRRAGQAADPLGALLARSPTAATPVARRPLSTYQHAAAGTPAPAVGEPR